MNKYYTYVYLDVRRAGKFEYGEYSFGFEPFYVGKGKGRRDKDPKNFRNRHFSYKAAKIEREAGKKPIVLRMLERATDQEAIELEKYLITLIGRADLGDGPLVNMTDGGGGISGHKHTSRTRKRMSESRGGEGNGMFGKKMPESAKKTLREKALKRTVSEETKKKMSESARHRPPVSGAAREKIRRSKLGKKRPYMEGAANPMNRPEVAQKVSDKLIGHEVSKETRDKISRTLRMNVARKTFKQLMERRQPCV